MNVYVPFPSCEIAKKSFHYSGAKNWNSLHGKIKDIVSIDGFKRDLKKNM